MATRRPPPARRPAACSPAGPAPITSTSYVSATMTLLRFRAAAVVVEKSRPAAARVVLAYSEDQVVSNEGYKVRPPSMKSVWPVMYAASSEHRKATAAAISSEPPARRIGMWLSTMRRLTGSSIHDRLIGVTVAPGPMLLTRIPRAAYSRASDRVRFCMPPLDTE